MNNNVTSKAKTYEGYKVVDKKAIITKSQMNMLSKQFDRFKKALNYDSLEPFVIDSINVSSLILSKHLGVLRLNLLPRPAHKMTAIIFL